MMPPDSLRGGALAGNGHLHLSFGVVAKPPDHRRRVVAQHGFGSRGQYRAHQPPLSRDQAVAYRVDARVQAVQPAHLEPVLDRPRPKTEGDQLAATHNAMLAAGELAD